MARALLLILDSVGIGGAPDAADYGDHGAATLQHTAAAVGGLALPTFTRLGLGCIASHVPGVAPIAGVSAAPDPAAAFGALRERSQGKDTITGHWELAGLHLAPGFAVMPPGPPSFPQDLIDVFRTRTSRGVLGNRAVSGTAVLDLLGEQHLRTGDWIVYTSVDSVFQLAAHEDVVPRDELYAACRIARELCDPLRVGRVIARPFTGAPGAFTRTDGRHDYAFTPPEPTVFERLANAGVTVCGIGKIHDIYAGRGIAFSDPTPDNARSLAALRARCAGLSEGLIVVNLIDFDMLYGHRRDPVGYARALETTDAALDALLNTLRPDDLLIVTADHGNDPTFRGTDHTRELVPLLVYRPGKEGTCLGLRDGYYDVAQSLATWFGIAPLPRGHSFL